jgi:hypothetical protein
MKTYDRFVKSIIDVVIKCSKLKWNHERSEQSNTRTDNDLFFYNNESIQKLELFRFLECSLRKANDIFAA